MRLFSCLFLGLIGSAASAQQSESSAWRPQPIAGHAVFELRVGADQFGPRHPLLCGEVAPTGWLGLEACGTGAGILHPGSDPEMAHFRTRLRTIGLQRGRTEMSLLVGAGLAEVQSGADRAGFVLGVPRDPDPVEAAGPEASVSLKSRLWMDAGGRTYATADLTAGAAYIPGAPAVLGTSGPTTPFASMTVGLGF